MTGVIVIGSVFVVLLGAVVFVAIHEELEKREQRRRDDDINGGNS